MTCPQEVPFSFILEFESGATQQLCGNSNNVSGDEDDLTHVAAEGTVLISIFKYDTNLNIVTIKAVEGTKLRVYDLPTKSVSVFDFHSQIK
jgi:hypothetical protein